MNPSRFLPLRLLAGATGFCLTLGCTSGQTGGQVGGPIEASGCTRAHTTLSPDEPSPLGFSGREALALTEGTHSAALDWGVEQEHQGRIAANPAAGLTEIALSIEYVGGKVQFVKEEPRDQRTDEGLEPVLPADPSACRDWISIEVQAHLSTSNGAIDHTFTAELKAYAADELSLRRQLNLEELGGSLALEPLEEGFTATRVSVTANFSDGSFSGDLSASLEGAHGDNRSQQPVSLGRWPAE